MPPTALVPPALRDAPFRGSAAVRAGLLTPRRLAGPTWRRLFPDVYLRSGIPVTHEVRAVAAAALWLPGAVVTGHSAAALWGVELAGPEDDVELTVPPGRHARRAAGVRVRRARLAGDEVCPRRGVPVTTPEATAVRLAVARSGDEAVVAVDRMIVAGFADLAAVRSLAARRSGPGARRARAACALADGLAESPPETRVRLLLARSGLPAPVAQYVVRDAGRFVARVDLAWPQHGVALEYDGLWHAEDGQFARDRRRLNRLQAAGWRVVFVTAADLGRPAEVVTRVSSALARAAVR